LLPLLLDALSNSRCLDLQQLQAFSRQAGLQQCVLLPFICHSNLKQGAQSGAMAGQDCCAEGVECTAGGQLRLCCRWQI
jgi:hypothetical protein